MPPLCLRKPPSRRIFEPNCPLRYLIPLPADLFLVRLEAERFQAGLDAAVIGPDVAGFGVVEDVDCGLAVVNGRDGLLLRPGGARTGLSIAQIGAAKYPKIVLDFYGAAV